MIPHKRPNPTSSNTSALMIAVVNDAREPSSRPAMTVMEMKNTLLMLYRSPERRGGLIRVRGHGPPHHESGEKIRQRLAFEAHVSETTYGW